MHTQGNHLLLRSRRLWALSALSICLLVLTLVRSASTDVAAAEVESEDESTPITEVSEDVLIASAVSMSSGDNSALHLEKGETVTVHYADENGKHQSKGPYLCAAFKDGDWGGIVPGETSSAGTRLSAYVVLKEVEGVYASDFRSSSVVSVGGVTYTVSEDVSCYNTATGAWFESLGRCLAFDGKMSLFVDGRNVVRGIEVRQR